jgi:hypothetical protein
MRARPILSNGSRGRRSAWICWTPLSLVVCTRAGPTLVGTTAAVQRKQRGGSAGRRVVLLQVGNPAPTPRPLLRHTGDRSQRFARRRDDGEPTTCRDAGRTIGVASSGRAAASLRRGDGRYLSSVERSTTYYLEPAKFGVHPWRVACKIVGGSVTRPCFLGNLSRLGIAPAVKPAQAASCPLFRRLGPFERGGPSAFRGFFLSLPVGSCLSLLHYLL